MSIKLPEKHLKTRNEWEFSGNKDYRGVLSGPSGQGGRGFEKKG
jgi:hypothetical protein